MSLSIRNANPYGPLTEERLEALERRIGTTLPSDYLDFLRQYNGGQPEPEGFWVVPGRYSSGVEHFLGLHDGPPSYRVDTYLDLPAYGMPQGLLAIGKDGVGNVICLRVDDEDRGAVYFFDHECHGAGMEHTYEGITRLASSFAEFLSMLRDIS